MGCWLRGALAAGAAIDAGAERSLLRASGAPDPRNDPTGSGSLRGETRLVESSDDTSLHVEIDEPEHLAGGRSADALTVFSAHGYALNLG